MGIVFDIEEFGVFDGPGIRSVVFLKGCPLRCTWCHNPEGLSPHPERYGLRIVGTEMNAEEVAVRIRRNEKLLIMNGGGVTFSGGEPLMQPYFVLAIREKLQNLHACLETCGYAPLDTFTRVVTAMNLVLLDIKLVDPNLHKRYTSVDNALILENLKQLKGMAIPFRIRVPLIPTVTDTEENLRAIAALLMDAKSLEKVELMRYNRAAGAKYASVGRTYTPNFPEDIEPIPHIEIFEEAHLPCEIL